MPYTYTYSYINDFNESLNESVLRDTINDNMNIYKHCNDVGRSGDNVNITFLEQPNQSEKTVLDGGLSQDEEHPPLVGSVLAEHDGPPSPPSIDTVNINNAPRVHPSRHADESGIGRGYAFSHNMCDRTTWYTRAMYIEEENIGTGDGIDTTFNLTNNYVIDLTHGKVMDENYIPIPSVGTDVEQPISWKPVVKINDIIQSERQPFSDSGGDYTIDYTNGSVTFVNPPSNGLSITCSYFYNSTDAGHSELDFIVPAGKKWFIDIGEAQFSKDIIMNDSVIWSVFYDDPQIGEIEVAPQRTIYKTVGNFLDTSFGSFPTIPALGGTSRGINQDHIILRWEYLSSVTLYQGLILRIWLKNDTPFDGERATFTIYAREEDDI